MGSNRNWLVYPICALTSALSFQPCDLKELHLQSSDLVWLPKWLYYFTFLVTYNEGLCWCASSLVFRFNSLLWFSISNFCMVAHCLILISNFLMTDDDEHILWVQFLNVGNTHYWKYTMINSSNHLKLKMCFKIL